MGINNFLWVGIDATLNASAPTNLPSHHSEDGNCAMGITTTVDTSMIIIL
jgi:hypothetical protein